MRGFGRGLSIAIASFALVACQEDGPSGPVEMQAFPDVFEAERTACERDGGRWAPRAGDAVYVCYRETPDAGKLCSGASDCEGLCLARSRTCSPITPFLGCHEVLTEGGGRATLCVQ